MLEGKGGWDAIPAFDEEGGVVLLRPGQDIGGIERKGGWKKGGRGKLVSIKSLNLAMPIEKFVVVCAISVDLSFVVYGVLSRMMSFSHRLQAFDIQLSPRTSL